MSIFQHGAVSAAVPILTYHNISKPPKGVSHPGLYLSPDQFRRHMWMLRVRGYRGVSMDDGLPYLRGEKTGKVAVITFDDGYQDNLENALPVLREFGFSATCYLVSDCLGSYNRWDAELLKVRKPLMDVAAVRQWLDAGMRVGSHTCSHPHLPRLEREAKRREIIASRLKLEALLGVSIEHLCYPFGEYDEECIEAATEVGYVTAVTTKRGTPRRDTRLLALPRLGNSGKKAAIIFFARTLSWTSGRV